MKRALVVSILVNVGLAAYLMFENAREPPTELASVRSLDALSADATDALTLRERLVAAGMSESDAKPVLLAALESQILSIEDVHHHDYWQAADNQAASDRTSEIETRRAAVRAALIAEYGEAARDDPAFVRAFKPLESQFPFLSSDQQIALRSLQLLRQGHAMAAVAGTARSTVGLAQLVEFEAAVRKIIPDEPTYFEFVLRESPLANQLRSSGIALTEAEYRDVFRAMHEFRSDPNPSRFVAQRESVRRVLGRDRAIALWAASDPSFAAIREAGKEHGLRDDTVLVAYELILAAQDDLFTMSRPPADSRASNDIRQRVESRDRALRELVGEDAAMSILRAHSARLMTLRDASTAKPVL